MAWTVDVVASAGDAQLDFVLPNVTAKDGDLAVFCLVADLFTVSTASVAALLAEEILSRATSVTGAALRGQVRLYQLERRGSSCGVLFCFSTVPFVTGVAGCSVSFGLRGVEVSSVGFVLTRLGDRSGAIDHYRRISLACVYPRIC